MKDKIRDCIKQYKAARKELKEIVQGEIAKAAKAIFEEHPLLKSFGWTQYTQYWNDGEETYFRANTEDLEQLHVNGEALYDADWLADVHWRTGAPNPKYNPELKRAAEAAHDFVQNLEGEFLSLFGDHKEITISAEGIKVSSYTKHD